MQLSLYLIVAAPLGHVERDRPALLLDHGQVLQVLVRVEEEFASVELDQYARHAPQVGLLIPRVVLQDDLGGSILSSIYDQCVSLVLVGCTAKVNHLDLT